MRLGSPAGSVTPESTQLRHQPPPGFPVVPVNVESRNWGGMHLSRLVPLSCDPETQEPPLTQQVINNPLAVLLLQCLPVLALPVCSTARQDVCLGQGQGLLPTHRAGQKACEGSGQPLRPFTPPASTGEAPGAAEISLVAPLSQDLCFLLPKASPVQASEEVSWVSWTRASYLPNQGWGTLGSPHYCRFQLYLIPMASWVHWSLHLCWTALVLLCPHLPGL